MDSLRLNCQELEHVYQSIELKLTTFMQELTIDSMAIIFDRDFGRVWSDGITPYVFSTLTRLPEGDQFKELTSRQVDLVRKIHFQFGNVYSITDLRLCVPSDHKHAYECISRHVVQQFKKGLKHKAFIRPGDRDFDSLLQHLVVQLKNYPITTYDSFEHALRGINEIRAVDMERKLTRHWALRLLRL